MQWCKNIERNFTVQQNTLNTYGINERFSFNLFIHVHTTISPPLHKHKQPTIPLLSLNKVKLSKREVRHLFAKETGALSNLFETIIFVFHSPINTAPN